MCEYKQKQTCKAREQEVQNYKYSKEKYTDSARRLSHHLRGVCVRSKPPRPNISLCSDSLLFTLFFYHHSILSFKL